MPQLNKGGKFIFGFSVIQPDLSVKFPPQTLLEYDITKDGKVIIFTGSKVTGGFCTTNYSLLYKLSGNNLIVAYFVNLPNAFVTYMLKFEQFPKMTMSSTVASIVTLCIIVVVFIMPVRANRKER